LNEGSETKQPLQKKKAEDKTFGISVEEFGGIAFDNEWPLIVKDLATYMIGVDML